MVQVESLEEARLHITSLEDAVADLRQEVESLKVNVHGPDQLWDLVRDHAQRWDTLQTPLWKRAWFRLDGWAGIRDLNAPGRSARPWHRRNP